VHHGGSRLWNGGAERPLGYRFATFTVTLASTCSASAGNQENGLPRRGGGGRARSGDPRRPLNRPAQNDDCRLASKMRFWHRSATRHVRRTASASDLGAARDAMAERLRPRCKVGIRGRTLPGLASRRTVNRTRSSRPPNGRGGQHTRAGAVSAWGSRGGRGCA